MSQAVIGVVDLGDTLYHRFMKNKYLNALRGVGARTVLLPWAQDEAEARAALRECGGLLLTGGADIAPALYGQEAHPKCGRPHQRRDTAEPLYLAEALRRKLPILGICRGCQMLNVALGGALWQDVGEMDGAHRRHMDILRRRSVSHTVTVAPDSLLAPLCAPEQGVNSMHHQTLRDIAPSLRCTAVSEDGVPEAVEGEQTPFLLGIQWHPEHLYPRDPCAARIFSAFAEAVAAQI